MGYERELQHRQPVGSRTQVQSEEPAEQSAWALSGSARWAAADGEDGSRGS